MEEAVMASNNPNADDPGGVPEEIPAAAAAARSSAATKTFTSRRKKVHRQAPQELTTLKKPKLETLPDNFLEFLPREGNNAPAADEAGTSSSLWKRKSCRQFWKAGEYEGSTDKSSLALGMDHIRVHPKFLHSNATSHKWALGAIAELLDNALDETANGASFINVDVIKNPKDESPMILFEDNGGGMTRHRMRECMSFGYSEKSKSANTIGQYGNGFKTSTMRLGSDVIVFSKSLGKNGQPATRSVGLLSYTFLKDTRQEDIMVPMLDYEEVEGVLKQVLRGSEEHWAKTVATITNWGPYRSEESLRNQFKKIKGHGTRIVIYNLWEDDQNQLELDFESDIHDIQARGVREDNNLVMASSYPSARHYFLYKHSLRAYASVLYLRLPEGFRITLRGQQIVHHNIVEDLMHIQEITYRPQGGQDALPGSNLCAVVTLGFVKDAGEHIDVQGFNVYHKNRLIKPFWRIFNSASSQGRGVVGVLEANFVEPAHDKQGFERTTVLQRLETRLQSMQKNYWVKNCHKVGYAGPPKKKTVAVPREDEGLWRPSTSARKARKLTKKDKDLSPSSSSADEYDEEPVRKSSPRKAKHVKSSSEPVKSSSDDDHDQPVRVVKYKPRKDSGAMGLRRTEANRLQSEVVVRNDTFQTVQAVQAVHTEAAVTDVQPVDNIGRLETIVADSDAGKLQLEILRRMELEKELEQEKKRRKELEAEILRMEEELLAVQQGILKERDTYKELLEDERRQREADDEEIRRQLRSALHRNRDLEVENQSLKGG